MENKTMIDRIKALCITNKTNIKSVCEIVNIPYKSCRVALVENRVHYKNLPQLAQYFNVSVEWIAHGTKKDKTTELPYAYINRELISFDEKLEQAFNELDTISNTDLRRSVTTVIEYYRIMELLLTSVTEQCLDVEDLLKKNQVTYSPASFERMRDKLKSLKREKV